jgi:transposase
VILDRDGGDFDRTQRLGATRFEHAVRREITKRGGQKPSLRILRNLVQALSDPAGVLSQRMLAVLDQLELTELVTSITGISAVGAATILAETGDPRRFATARALVNHAGLAPREKLSGTFTGRTKLTGQRRPRLRVTARRAVWGAQRANPVHAARYRHLTSREHTKLKPTQAHTVIAATILRHLHAVVTTGRAWDPNIATHGTRSKTTTELAA